MKKSIIAAICMVALSQTAYAGDEALRAYISAPEIAGLYVRINESDNAINYSFTTKTKSDVSIGNTSNVNGKDFLVDSKVYDNIPVYVENYNPLKYSIRFDNKNGKEPVFDTGKFFDVFLNYQDLVGGTLQSIDTSAYRTVTSQTILPEVAVTKSKGKINVRAKVSADIPQIELPSVPKECNDLFDSYNKLLSVVNCGDDEQACKDSGLLLTKDDIGKWSGTTTSENGIKAVIKTIEDNNKILETNISEIKKLRKEIETQKSEIVCPGVPVKVLSEISYVMTRASEATAQRELFIKYLSNMHTYLKKYENNWRGNYFKANTIQSPVNDNLIKSAMTISKYQYSTDTSNLAFVEKTDSKIEGSFTLHRKEKVVIEPGVAVVYSGLTYNLFSTKTVNGNTVVSKTEKDDPFHAAVVLNFLPTAYANEVISPLFQIGLSSAKEYPALMFGVGGRLFAKPLAFAVGSVFGFTKELNTLSEGSVISGQADIDKDLKTKVVPSWYLSVQYNF